MSERTTENGVTTVRVQLEEEEESRGEGKGEENEQASEEGNVAAVLSLKMQEDDQMQEDSEERVESQVPASKNRPGRVQTVFCLVRDQIRGQPGREASKTGMLQLVQHVTRQLDRAKVEPGGFEDTSPRKEVREILEIQQEMPVELENEESEKDECVVLLKQILNSIEGLRKEVSEELNLLRRESQSNTDKVLRDLQTRLVHSLNSNTNTPVSDPPLLVAPRKHILRRTLTTVAPKNSTAQAFRPRCMSEPVRRQNGSVTLPVSSLKPLLPSLVVRQQTKKPVYSKPGMNKPAS